MSIPKFLILVVEVHQNKRNSWPRAPELQKRNSHWLKLMYIALEFVFLKLLPKGVMLLAHGRSLASHSKGVMLMPKLLPKVLRTIRIGAWCNLWKPSIVVKASIEIIEVDPNIMYNISHAMPPPLLLQHTYDHLIYGVFSEVTIHKKIHICFQWGFLHCPNHVPES